MRRQDEEHVAAIPEREREEVRQVLAGWGLDDELRERVVDAVTADPDRWIGLMMLLEHGFSPSRTGPPAPRWRRSPLSSPWVSFPWHRS
jgi:vacuolar iron transporter family protein